MAEPEIDLDKVGFIIEKARAFEVPETRAEDDEAVYEPEPATLGLSVRTAVERDDLTNARLDDPAFVEARSHIMAMNIDEQCQLVALAWVGRGDFAREEWDDAVRIARQEHNNRTAEYLFGMPHLPDHLQAGLDAFDR